MRNLTLFISALLVSAIVVAQTPQLFSYQAVVRNSSDQLVTGTVVGMRISILQNSASGTVVYTETQTPETNENGLLSVVIGSGAGFDMIDWATDIYFIKTEIDPAGGTNYTITGVSQLLSVPYALHAKTAETLSGGISESDPVFTSWDKSSGISITESQVSDFGSYIEAESDPVYGVSVASGITSGNIYNWNNKIDIESDPVFTSWDKSSGISITESQVSDFGSYIEAESDPVYGASVASGITSGNIYNWNNKIDTESDPVFTSWDKSSGISITESQVSGLQDYATKNMNNENITNLADPVNAQDAATKTYVDDIYLDLKLDIYAEIGVSDIEGNHYPAVRIGDQVWMAENLKTTKLNDGSDIEQISLWSDWIIAATGAMCWFYNDQATYGNTYGALYNFYTVNTGMLCPTGWHVPTQTEWETLISYLGGETVAGGELKETGFTYWANPNTGATNSAGFNGRGCGNRNSSNGDYEYDQEEAYFWTSTQSPTVQIATNVKMEYISAQASMTIVPKKQGNSVRCVKD